jgi:hypothetical protein
MAKLLTVVAVALLSLGLGTGYAHAAPPSEDLAEVAIGTFLVALGLFFLMYVVYVLKAWLGLVKMPPPEDHDAAGHH